MPKQYEAIRDTYIKQGMNTKDAKTTAAKIFISKGKGGSRHSRAKALHSDPPAKSKPKTGVIPAKAGHKTIKFQEGGLHESTGTDPDKKIGPAKHAEAASGKLGPKAVKQEAFYQNVLHH